MGKVWPTVNHTRGNNLPALKANQSVRLVLDLESLLRNPATGWMVYDDAYDEVAKADEY